MFPAILISTVFIFTAATCWRHVRRPTHTICDTWVASHVPRVEIKAFYESTTIQVFVKDVASLRRRLKNFHILTKPVQFGGELRRFLEFTNIADPREQSSETSVTSEWASGWEDVSDSVTTDDGGDECMGAWLPVATGMEDDSTCQQQDLTVIKYRATLELVIDKLYAIGYRRFAFKHLKSDHSPFSHVAAVRQQPHNQDYSLCYESTSWLENLSTTCTIFPEALVRDLKNHSRKSNGAWLTKIPGFATDAAFVSLIRSRTGRSYWQFLKPGDSVDEKSRQSDAPCLWVASITRHRALLLFTNTTLSDYYSRMDIVQVQGQIESFPWERQKESNFADETSSNSFYEDGLLQTRRSEQLFQWHDQGILDSKADSHSLNDRSHLVEGHFVGCMQGWSEERISTAHSSIKLDLSSKRLTSLDTQIDYRSQLLRRTNAVRATKAAIAHGTECTDLYETRDLARHINKANNSMIRADRSSAHKTTTWEDFRRQELHPPAHDMLTTSRHATAKTQPRDELQHLGHNTSRCLPQAISRVEPYVYDQWSKTDDSVESGESRVAKERPYSSAQLSRDIVTAEKVQRRLRSSSKSLRKRLGFKRQIISLKQGPLELTISVDCF
jgi:hypothetical protein